MNIVYFYNVLALNFAVKCYSKSPLIRKSVIIEILFMVGYAVGLWQTYGSMYWSMSGPQSKNLLFANVIVCVIIIITVA